MSCCWSASDSTYAYTFLCHAVCLSAMCLSRLCPLLKHALHSDTIWCVHFVQSSATLVLDGGGLTTRVEIFGQPPPPRKNMLLQIASTAAVLCCQLANTNEESDCAFHQTTLILVSHTMVIIVLVVQKYWGQNHMLALPIQGCCPSCLVGSTPLIDRVSWNRIVLLNVLVIYMSATCRYYHQCCTVTVGLEQETELMLVCL